MNDVLIIGMKLILTKKLKLTRLLFSLYLLDEMNANHLFDDSME